MTAWGRGCRLRPDPWVTHLGPPGPKTLSSSVLQGPVVATRMTLQPCCRSRTDRAPAVRLETYHRARRGPAPLCCSPPPHHQSLGCRAIPRQTVPGRRETSANCGPGPPMALLSPPWGARRSGTPPFDSPPSTQGQTYTAVRRLTQPPPLLPFTPASSLTKSLHVESHLVSPRTWTNTATQ